MNYGKKGVRIQQRTLNSKTIKIERKILLGIVKLSLIAMVGVGICAAAAGIGIFKGIISSTPVIPLNAVVASGEATIVYDCAGNEIDKYVGANSNRQRVDSIDQLPDYLGKAFVAIEDERFYQHNGIDYKSMVRSLYQFVKTRGEETQGASTITQQLLKNTVFTSWTSEGKNMIKKFKRKFQEQYLALEISKYYSKDQILLEYMNAINLGQNTLGVEAAAKRYFGKSASELTISESAVIASITQNPYKYNPISFPEENVKRRERCLNKMLELEFITQAQYDEAMADTEAVYDRIGNYDTDYRESAIATSSSYFSDALYEQVRSDLVTLGGLTEANAEKMLTAGGLRIYSTLDPDIQAIADEEFSNPENFPEKVDWYLNYALSVKTADGMKNFSKENMMTWFKQNGQPKFNLIFSSQEEANEAIATYRTAVLNELGVSDDEDNYQESSYMTPQPQAAIVVSDQSTGYVVAIVGGRGNKEGRRTLNRATNSTRLPGSTFKVLAAFAPALDSAGQTLATVYMDTPFNYDDGTPVRNWYSHTATPYRNAPQAIRVAIRDSLNIIAVKTTTVITPQLSYDYLLNFGFTTLTDGTAINGKVYTDVRQPICLGGLTNGVTPYELNAAYAAIANLGSYIEPKLYSKVVDSEGNVILDNTSPRSRQVLKETTAYLLTNAMMDVINAGTGNKARFSRTMACAGKTGTTSDNYDLWMAGYSPYYTCTVWTGYDNNIYLKEPNTSMYLWKAVMSRIHEELPDRQFIEPTGLVRADVCSKSGLLPIPGLCDEHIRSEVFTEGTVPTESCNIHYEGNICAYDGLPATPMCPFPTYGRLERPLVEHPALLAGSTMITTNPDGTQNITMPNTAEYCQHNEEFFANPDWPNVQATQQAELDRRAAEAAAAAAAAAAAGQ